MMKRETFDMSKLKEKISAMNTTAHHAGCCEGSDDEHSHEEAPIEIRRRVHALEKLQQQKDLIALAFRKELLQLERNYAAKYAPLNADRASIVNGVREPTLSELEDFAESGVEEVTEDSAKSSNTGIPLFWVTAFQNHPQLGPLITEQDCQALESLKDVRSSFLEGKLGFKLEFEFHENDFFTNKVLTKEYHLEEPQDSHGDGDFMYDHATGTEIAWKADKNLCFKTVIRTQRHKGNNTMRTVKREERLESFFHFFNPPQLPDEDEDEEKEPTEEANEIEAILQLDYEIGDMMKDQIIPNAVDWYTGRALEYMDYEDDEYSDEGDYDEYDEEQDSEEDEEASDQEYPEEKAQKTNKNRRGQGEDKPECKQQ